MSSLNARIRDLIGSLRRRGRSEPIGCAIFGKTPVVNGHHEPHGIVTPGIRHVYSVLYREGIARLGDYWVSVLGGGRSGGTVDRSLRTLFLRDDGQRVQCGRLWIIAEGMLDAPKSSSGVDISNPTETLADDGPIYAAASQVLAGEPFGYIPLVLALDVATQDFPAAISRCGLLSDALSEELCRLPVSQWTALAERLVESIRGVPGGTSGGEESLETQRSASSASPVGAESQLAVPNLESDICVDAAPPVETAGGVGGATTSADVPVVLASSSVGSIGDREIASGIPAERIATIAALATRLDASLATGKRVGTSSSDRPLRLVELPRWYADVVDEIAGWRSLIRGLLPPRDDFWLLGAPGDSSLLLASGVADDRAWLTVWRAASEASKEPAALYVPEFVSQDTIERAKAWWLGRQATPPPATRTA